MRIGIDLGGTKIEVIALDDGGRELLRKRVATPAGDYGGTLKTIVGLVTFAEDQLGRKGKVGVGMPGAISRKTGLVKNANSTVLNGRALQQDLSILLGRDVRLENDANCFAMSEACDGAGAGREVVFGVILGTGVGGGLVAGGHLLRGAATIAGEWGHTRLPSRAQLGADASWDDSESPGPACYCGRFGCVETWLSGPGLLRDYLRTANTADIRDTRGVVERATRGDPLARLCLERYADRCARALAQVINIVDPDVIVLGGGMSAIPGLAGSITAALPPYVFSDEVGTRIVLNQHGDSSGVRGAAWLWGPAG